MIKYRKCNHFLTTRITFDIGSSNTSVYDLCINCKEFSVFKEHVISQEAINKNCIEFVPFMERLKPNKRVERTHGSGHKGTTAKNDKARSCRYCMGVWDYIQ